MLFLAVLVTRPFFCFSTFWPSIDANGLEGGFSGVLPKSKRSPDEALIELMRDGLKADGFPKGDGGTPEGTAPGFLRTMSRGASTIV